MSRSVTRWVLPLSVGLCLVTSLVFAQGARMEAYESGLQQKLDSMIPKDSKVKVELGDSASGGGMNVEIRITMPMDKFMDFAPVAVLEAAGLPHKFPTVHIVLRQEPANRVGRIAFADAEPVAGKYLAGERLAAIEQMKKKIIWH